MLHASHIYICMSFRFSLHVLLRVNVFHEQLFGFPRLSWDLNCTIVFESNGGYEAEANRLKAGTTSWLGFTSATSFPVLLCWFFLALAAPSNNRLTYYPLHMWESWRRSASDVFGNDDGKDENCSDAVGWVERSAENMDARIWRKCFRWGFEYVYRETVLNVGRTTVVYPHRPRLKQWRLCGAW